MVALAAPPGGVAPGPKVGRVAVADRAEQLGPVRLYAVIARRKVAAAVPLDAEVEQADAARRVGPAVGEAAARCCHEQGQQEEHRQAVARRYRRGESNSILNMKVFLLAAAGSGNLANEHSLDLLISLVL
jgi:hypothetical protein